MKQQQWLKFIFFMLFILYTCTIKLYDTTVELEERRQQNCRKHMKRVQYFHQKRNGTCLSTSSYIQKNGDNDDKGQKKKLTITYIQYLSNEGRKDTPHAGLHDEDLHNHFAQTMSSERAVSGQGRRRVAPGGPQSVAEANHVIPPSPPCCCCRPLVAAADEEGGHRRRRGQKKKLTITYIQYLSNEGRRVTPHAGLHDEDLHNHVAQTMSNERAVSGQGRRRVAPGGPQSVAEANHVILPPPPCCCCRPLVAAADEEGGHRRRRGLLLPSQGLKGGGEERAAGGDYQIYAKTSLKEKGGKNKKHKRERAAGKRFQKYFKTSLNEKDEGNKKYKRDKTAGEKFQKYAKTLLKENDQRNKKHKKDKNSTRDATRGKRGKEKRPAPKKTIIRQGLHPHPGPRKRLTTKTRMRITKKTSVRLAGTRDSDDGQEHDEDLADFSEKHAQEAKEREDTKAQLANDQTSLANLKEKRANTEADYETSQNTNENTTCQPQGNPMCDECEDQSPAKKRITF